MPRSTPGGPSSTQDTASHHTSPNKAAGPQKPMPAPPKKTGAREVTGALYNPKMPDHVTKHPNPVGRPKNPRY